MDPGLSTQAPPNSKHSPLLLFRTESLKDHRDPVPTLILKETPKHREQGTWPDTAKQDTVLTAKGVGLCDPVCLLPGSDSPQIAHLT